MSATTTERVEYWGGPRCGLAMTVAVEQRDGAYLPALEAPEGRYRLTTDPAARTRDGHARRRVWRWSPVQRAPR